MKYIFVGRILAIILATGFGGVFAQAQRTNNSTPLTNAAVVRLVKAGFKEKTITSIIAARPANFDLSTERMIELKRNGVSERLILAMLSRQEGMALMDDSWTDDPFFDSGGDMKKGGTSRSQPPTEGTSTDIFGSSGGIKGEQRSRGGNGSASNDTVTTGSATVRILRPPTEANTPPKLERTLTLTNASVIELVEAGFSEGTIIRRIEQSSVNFDLSPSQVNELRRRRVSEKLLAAMQIAMGDEPGTKKTPTPNEKPTKQSN
jgi:hypothetical protein